MNSGDAAEQVVRIALDGGEVAVKLVGSGVKNLALILAAALKKESKAGKTRGKARLSQMIKSGKELKVFTIPGKDVATFTSHAKQYGVLYTILRDKKNPNAPVDIIARAEDASKIQRIVEKFQIAGVDKAIIVGTAEREAVEHSEPVKSQGERIVDEAMGDPNKEKSAPENPTAARTDKNPPSEQSSDFSKDEAQSDKGAGKPPAKKPSVKEKLERFKAEAAKQKEAERSQPVIQNADAVLPKPNGQTVHQQPKINLNPKER